MKISVFYRYIDGYLKKKSINLKLIKTHENIKKIL